MEGVNRAEGNRRSTYPLLHIFLSKVWRKRIGEYVSKSPEHNHTAQEAYQQEPRLYPGDRCGVCLTAHTLLEGTEGGTVKKGMI